MSQKFGTSIDLTGNVIKNAGLEVVSALPTTFLVEGREVIFQGEVLRYLNGEWHIDSFSAYTLKTYAELKGLKDSNALVTGSLYVLTDFYTTYLAEDQETWLGGPDCEVIDHLGNPIISDNYHILLQATSENTFSPQVYLFNQSDSEKPYMRRLSEWIVYFDIDLDLFGRIIYMYDVVHNNTFDFDIFNIRWGLKGYQIDLTLTTNDYRAINNNIEPFNNYYVWSIGDLGGPYESSYSIYELSNNTSGVLNTTILQSHHIFIRVNSTVPVNSAYNYYQSYVLNTSVTQSSYFITGLGIMRVSISEVNHFYSIQQCNQFLLNKSNSILSLSQFSRGLNIGSRYKFHENSQYLTFIFPGAAYIEHSIFLAEYSCFLATQSAPTIIQHLNVGYPRMQRACFINRNTEGIGGTNTTLNIQYFKESIIDVTGGDYECNIFSFLFCNRNLEIESNFDTLSDNNIELNATETNAFLNYVNSKNEPVRTSINDEATIINTVNVVFFESFKKQVNRTHFMPFVCFIENPTAWGYEIEGVKYPTHEDFPVLAGVFCNSGSNTLNFAKKTLKFYVETAGETYYSSEYMINQNNTLTLITQ